VFRGGVFWLAKSAAHWKAEMGLTPKQTYRSTNVLKSRGLIETKVMRFAGNPTTHLRLTEEGHKLLSCHSGSFHLPSKEGSFSLEDKSLTETTTEITTDINSAGKPAMEMQIKNVEKGNKEENKIVVKENLGEGDNQEKE